MGARAVRLEVALLWTDEDRRARIEEGREAVTEARAAADDADLQEIDALLERYSGRF